MFRTICPKCGAAEGTLQVVEVTLYETGERILLEWVILYTDGFDFFDQAPEDVRNLSTQDEIVWCKVCEAYFPLSEVTL